MKRPDGCYMYPCNPDMCTDASCPQCYFYNGDGAPSDEPKGVPVCERPKYIYGKSVAGTSVDAANNPMCESSFQSANGQYRVVGVTGAQLGVDPAKEIENEKAIRAAEEE